MAAARAACTIALVAVAAWWLLPRGPSARPGPPDGASHPLDSLRPDEIRRTAPPAARRDMRCGEKIPPYSLTVTHGVEIFAEAFHEARDEAGEGAAGREHVWTYRLTLRNTGSATVQLLTRHWQFVDGGGATHEVKGPGVRGDTPVLPPGREYKYSSGTTLKTAAGSMHGSFQFATLDGGRAADRPPPTFNARVGRLALTRTGRPADVPCGQPASWAQLPPTSVAVGSRVIVGVTAELASTRSASAARHRRGAADVGGAASAAVPPAPPAAGADDGGDDDEHVYLLDVQVNNAREADVLLLGGEWRLSRASGASASLPLQLPSTPGGALRIRPGRAVRFPCLLALPAEDGSGVAHGELRACLLEAGDDADDAAAAGCASGAVAAVPIEPLALTPDGGPLDARPFEAAGGGIRRPWAVGAESATEGGVG